MTHSPDWSRVTRRFVLGAGASLGLVGTAGWAQGPGQTTLVAFDERFWSLVPRGAQAEVIASGHGLGTVPEGQPDYGASLESPLWWPEQSCLIFSDIPRNRIMKWSPQGGLSVLLEPSGHANGLWFDPQGRLLMAEHSGRQVSRVERDGSRTVVMRSYRNQRLNRPNSVITRSDGGIYFTDYGFRPGPREDWDVDFEGIYHVSADLGTRTLLLRDIERPHKLLLSPDERTLYVGQYLGILAFDIEDLQSPVAGERVPGARVIRDSRRWFWQAENGPPVTRAMAARGARMVDGMKMDEQGNIWFAGREGVWVISAGGELLGRIDLGRSTPNICFGGQDRRDLFIIANQFVLRIPTRVAGVPIPTRPAA